MNPKYSHHHIYDLCMNHMHSYVLIHLADGAEVDGIVTGLDDEHVYVAVPKTDNENWSHYRGEHDERQYGYYGGYHHGFGYPGYGYRPRRFNRLVLPLAAITALSLLPWY